MQLFVEHARRSIQVAETAPPCGRVAGLFEQLARGGFLERFARFQCPGWRFPERLVNREAEIAQQANVLGIDDRQDDDRAGMQDDIATDGLAVGPDAGIHGDLDLATSMNDFSWHTLKFRVSSFELRVLGQDICGTRNPKLETSSTSGFPLTLVRC